MKPAGHDPFQQQGLTRASGKKNSRGLLEIFQGHFQKSGYFRGNFRGRFQFRGFSGISGISGVAGHPAQSNSYISIADTSL